MACGGSLHVQYIVVGIAVVFIALALIGYHLSSSVCVVSCDYGLAISCASLVVVVVATPP